MSTNTIDNQIAEQTNASALHRRLLCIYPWLTLGGADKFNLDMLGELRQHGWQIEIVTTLQHNHPWRERFAALASKIHDIGQLDAQLQLTHMLAILAAARPDIVLISHSRFGYALLPYLRAHYPDMSFVDYNHMVDPDDPHGGYPYSSISQQQALDLQIVSSKSLATWMLTQGAQADRIAVCTTNIDAQLWQTNRAERSATRRQLAIPEHGFVGLYAARFEAIKQPVQSFEIMQRMVSISKDSYFLIAGQGSYEPFLRSRLKHGHLGDRIRFLGSVSHERIHELLSASDVLLLSSRSEGISLAIYEAMAMGVVPISVDASGQSELVTPECGILIKHSPQDVENYSKALLALANDRKRLQSMSDAARHRITMYYRLDQMGDRMHALFLEAIRLHQVQPRPRPTPEQVRISARHAMSVARQDFYWTQPPQTLPHKARQLVRSLYWQLVEQGAWWLVPALEHVRTFRLCS